MRLGYITAIDILERLGELNRPYSHGNLVDKGKTLPESPQAPYHF